MPAEAVEVSFRAMGTDVHLVAVGGPESALHRGARRIADLEARWSRFLAGSELSRLNALAGRPVPVSAETFALVEECVGAWRRSGGLFDPTVLTTLVSLGYDRSFEDLEADGPEPLAPAPPPGCAGIVLSAGPGLVLLPAGVALDPGGMAKGLAADWVAEQLLEDCAGACVNLGGDVRVAGPAPTGEGWHVAVEDPNRPDAEVLRLALAGGAVCTSSRLRRRWRRDGQERHHIVDPRTGRPASTTAVAATAVAGTAAEAEVLCKVALLGGTERAADLLAGTPNAVLTMDEEGRVAWMGEGERFAA